MPWLFAISLILVVAFFRLGVVLTMNKVLTVGLLATLPVIAGLAFVMLWRRLRRPFGVSGGRVPIGCGEGLRAGVLL